MAQVSQDGQRVVIVSADCHAGPQQVSDYEWYTPEIHKDALRDYVSCIDAFEAERTVASGAGGRGGAVSRDDLGLWDMPTRRQRMEADGIVAEVIFPQGAVPFAPYPAVGPTRRIEWIATPEQYDAGPEIYNRWLADFCSTEPEVHYGVAVIPASDVDAAVGEVARARESGLRGGISLPPVREDRTYNDRSYDRLWAACQDYDMVLNIHGGAGITYSGGVEVLAINLSETDFFTRRTLWFLIFSGVFERFPRIHMAITEQRAHWVPTVLAELDSIYRSARCADLRKELPRLPSEYFATNCFVGASFMSKPECELRHQIGVDRLMWGSDYPHAEGVWPWVHEGLRWTFDGVEEPEVRRLLGGNAIDCYGFDTERLGQRARLVGPAVKDITQNPLATPPDEPGVELSWAFRSSPWA